MIICMLITYVYGAYVVERVGYGLQPYLISQCLIEL